MKSASSFGERISRFWDRYLGVLDQNGVKPLAARWYVMRVDHRAEDSVSYLHAVDRDKRLLSWQMAQRALVVGQPAPQARRTGRTRHPGGPFFGSSLLVAQMNPPSRARTRSNTFVAVDNSKSNPEAVGKGLPTYLERSTKIGGLGPQPLR